MSSTSLYKMQDNFDAIIVLGNSTREEEIDGIMKNRLEKALEIYGKNQKTKIILSGGKEEKGISEAQKMRRYLEKWGLTEEIFILEEQSRNTFENLKNSKEIIIKHQFKNIALITSDYHLKRASMIAKSLDINISAISAPTPKNKKISAPMKEFFKKIFDYLRIKIQ